MRTDLHWVLRGGAPDWVKENKLKQTKNGPPKQRWFTAKLVSGVLLGIKKEQINKNENKPKGKKTKQKNKKKREIALIRSLRSGWVDSTFACWEKIELTGKIKLKY